jgi:hypothetical protein
VNLIQFQQRYDLGDFLRMFGKSQTPPVVKVDLGFPSTVLLDPTPSTPARVLGTARKDGGLPRVVSRAAPAPARLAIRLGAF